MHKNIREHRSEDQRQTHTVLVLRTHHWEGNYVTAFPAGTDPSDAVRAAKATDITSMSRASYRVLPSLDGYAPRRKTHVVAVRGDGRPL